MTRKLISLSSAPLGWRILLSCSGGVRVAPVVAWGLTADGEVLPVIRGGEGEGLDVCLTSYVVLEPGDDPFRFQKYLGGRAVVEPEEEEEDEQEEAPLPAARVEWIDPPGPGESGT